AAAERAELRRRLADDEVVASLSQVKAVAAWAAAGVRRRLQRSDQPHLLQCRLELGAEHAPLDPPEREQRRLDGGPLAIALEVRTKPRAQVPRPADVEHLFVPV